MQTRRNSNLIYGLLFAVWVLVVAWQVEEHARVREAAKTDLRNRSQEIANTVSAVIRAARFRGTVVQDRLEPVLKLLVNGRTNALVKSSELISITLLNTNGDPVVSVGNTNLFSRDILAGSELWSADHVSFVMPVEGTRVAEGMTNNPTVVLPSFRDMTNGLRGGERNFSRPEPPPDGPPPTNAPENFSTNGEPGGPPPDNGGRARGNRGARTAKYHIGRCIRAHG